MSSSSQRKLVSSADHKAHDILEDGHRFEPPVDKPTTSHGWRFWAVFISLSISAFLSALEGAVVSTALPSVSRAVNAGKTTSGCAAVQPLYSQLADIWGRRWPMITALCIFALGSGIAGVSNSASMLIGGRTIQGLGAAGINVLVEIIICDLLPLRERGQFMGLMFVFIVLGSTSGPFLGWHPGLALCAHPAMPKALFGNRTSVAALLATFMQLMVSYVPLYFLPLYFQAVQRVSPSRSGVQIIPFSATFCVSGLVGGILVSKLGRFKGVHIISFALQIVSLETFTLLDGNSTMAVWVILQLIFGWSVGMPTPSLLTAIQADIPDSLNAASTGAFAFVRSVATIFTVSVPAAVFANRFDQLLTTTDVVRDPATQAALARGLAYEKASRDFINSFPQEIQDDIISLYELSLKRVWYVSMAFAGAGFLFVLLEKNLVTREAKDTSQFELQDHANNTDGNGAREPRVGDD
ncbi:hypothetical protein DL766_000148 [Monosporascus sp. MC13-8B]|uniref:Major facilitator superfamily (MFS) profile domain-containing protein n=1 Tax=Monosporascus cannonballus TaxID=155416 RepID=A0ABY0H7D8_9PEZI|nr:hypothetical protein DL762_004585 [Monosporascus cannonballus]RYO92220.1 hypothetical protein DL763_004750 [Monosporascus cannonballus]RYP39939.1 hypothetical protein DL766_000148 [Monosporascus sp. MC13-8B]